MTYDCIGIRDLLIKARERVQEKALLPLKDFRDSIRSRIYYTYLEMINTVETTRQVKYIWWLRINISYNTHV